MPTYTWNAIYLGNSDTFMDPYEGNTRAENADSFVGNTYGTGEDPLYDNIVDVTANEVSGYWDTMDNNNWYSNDSISYDLGGGTQTHTFDTVVSYKALITYSDGTQATVDAGIMQDTSGNLFLIPVAQDSFENTQIYETKAIQSLELQEVTGDNYTGMYASRVDTEFVCFASGTMIDTPDGPRPVQELQEGDLVHTLDHGPQPIIWKGGRRVLARGPARAYRVTAGVLGNGLPSHDLILSAQHRVMLRSPVAARMIGSTEVLVAITKLESLPGISIAEDLSEVEYHHFLCARHELVQANGSWCETLLPGPQAVEMLGPQALDEIEERLPNWRDMHPARPILDGKRGRDLSDRHQRHKKPLVQSRSARAITNAERRSARG